MAQQDEIVLDVKINTQEVAKNLSEAIQKVAELKARQKELRAEIEAGNDANGEYAKELASVTGELEANNRVVKSNTALLQAETLARLDDNASLDDQRQALNAAQKAYASLSGEELKAANAAGGLRDQIAKLSDRVKEQEAAIGDARRNVGNYAMMTAEAAGQMGFLGRGLQSVVNPVKNVTMGFKAMAATPLLATISILITIFQKLSERFRGNQAAMEKLTPLFGAFAGAGNLVNKVLDKIADGLGWIAQKALQLAKKLGVLKGSLLEGTEIAKEDLAIQQERQKVDLANAESQNKIAKLRAQAAEKDKYSAEQRLKMIQQANNEEEAISKRQYDLAKREYDLQVRKNAQSASSQDDLKKENDLRIAMINAETALFQKRKELNSQMAQLRAEESKDTTAQSEAARKEAEANTKLAEEQAKKLEDLRDELQRRNRTDLENAVADLKKKMNEELAIVGLTEAEKQAIRKYYEDQETKLYAKAEQERERLEEEAAQYIKDMRADVLRQQYQDELAQLQEYYDKGLILVEEYEAARAQIEEQYALAKAERRAEEAQQYVDAVQGLNSAINSVEDAALARFEQGQDERKKALDKRLQAGQISEEQYAKETQKIDEETERKKIEIERDQAIREKAMGIMQATIDTAMAIIKALADPGGFAGLALSALAGVTGAAQIAAIAAQPLPQFSTGGVVGGKSYTGDKVLTRQNSREMDLTLDQQKRLFDALSSSDNQTLGIDYGMMAQAVSQLPAPVMVYTELQEFGDRVATIQEIASV